MRARIGPEHAGNEAQQIRAWEVQVDALKATLSSLGSDASNWGILFDYHC